MKKNIIVIFITILGFTSYSFSQTSNELNAKGEFTEIDVQKQKEIIGLLNGDDKTKMQQTIDSVLAKPNRYIPPVFYILSNKLFEQDKKDDAMYWFYLAQLRARYDSNLCLDESAKQQVGVLNMNFGPDINEYAFKNIDKLEKTVNSVVEFVKNNEENYDHRWLNLYGMGAIIKSLDENSETPKMSKPKEEWAAIKKKTIEDYHSGFLEFVKKQKK